jgi:hypothetical protein
MPGKLARQRRRLVPNRSDLTLSGCPLSHTYEEPSDADNEADHCCFELLPAQ